MRVVWGKVGKPWPVCHGWWGKAVWGAMGQATALRCMAGVTRPGDVVSDGADGTAGEAMHGTMRSGMTSVRAVRPAW